MTLKVFIADDDAGMRLVLRNIIESTEDMELIGEAADGGEAVRRCVELKPDVVFIDVEMPGITGVEASKQIRALLPDCALVFVTAHSEYMQDAFEFYAFDYLVKPFKTDRVRQTLRRIQKASLKEKVLPAPALMIKNRDAISFVPIKDIILIYIEGRTTYIVTPDASYATSESLSDIARKLDDATFFRCHRAYIVNITAVTKVYPYGRWTYLVKLKGTDKDALITHEKLEKLQSILGV
ncbi:MAG: response regulator transcription factor [Clostridiales bacterium]|mgnify:CR=1 FL=1|nr:response regulator transcription factor [Clostridiales bacterium]